MLKGGIAALALLAGGFVFLRFFFGGSDLVDEPKPAAEAPIEVYDVAGNYVRTEGEVAKPGQGSAAAKVIDPYKGLEPGQRYVAELADKGRVRLAARATINDRELAVVEWVDSSGNTVESLDLTQLRELGMTVTGKAFGFELVAGSHTIIATPWPRVMPVRQLDAQLYNTSTAGAGPGTVALATGGSEGEGARPNTP